MNRLQTSMQIFRQSWRVLKKHPKLLLLPLVNAAFVVVTIGFFLLAGLSLSSHAPVQQGEALTLGGMLQKIFQHPGASGPATVKIALVFVYFASMFVTTFANVVFYSEILQAFNGRSVSITRGIQLAVRKLKVIVWWSLLSGVVGSLIRLIEERSVGIGRWILALIGISWSVASAFAIPVIIKEQGQSDPLTILKHSGNLIRQTWGESATCILGVGVLARVVWFFVMLAGIFLSILATQLFAMLGMHSFGYFAACIVLFGAVPSAAVLVIFNLISNVYVCGLYIYASEGVIPAEFDENILQKAWRIKS